MRAFSRLPMRPLRWLLLSAAVTAVLFAVAGRWDLPMLWAYAAVCSALVLIGVLTLDPDVTRERLRRPSGGLDPLRLEALRALALVHVVLGALDVGRLHLSDTVPGGLRIAGLVGFAISARWVLWAIAVNRFFVPTVRIQSERGHRLITDGPYRFVRHPGYAGMAIGIPLSALALGSWMALIPALAYSFLILRRVADEDRFLGANLAGYEDYARRVRFRLAPRIW